MSKSFHDKLIDLLKTEKRFVDDEGELVKHAVIDAAWKIDKALIKLLLSDAKIKEKFFEDIDKHWVFNINTFIDFVSDKSFLSNSYTRFRNQVGLNIDGKFLRERGEVSLVWPYKDCVLEGGQTREEEKRKEIFFNEILAQDEIDRLLDPKVLTSWKRYTPDGEEKVKELRRDENGIIRENLIMKGNNLLALHTLKTQFRGRVKLIYIDPPYNTGTDSFGYNDNFNHSGWLTFMKNRLEVARDLLKDDGLIFIHIGDVELHYLKLVADEVFGRDNFVATIPRKTRSGKSDVPYKLSQDFDWMITYTKKAPKTADLFQRTVQRKYYKTDDFPEDEWRLADLTKQTSTDERPNSDFTLVNPRNGEKFPVNPNRSWAITTDTAPDYLKKKKIVFPGDYAFLNLKQPAMRVFKSEEIEKKGEDFDKAYVSSEFLNQAMEDFLSNTANKNGTDEITGLFGGKTFAYPKNELLLRRILEFTTKEGDLVLDFFAGSGTTAAVARKMKRQFITVEQMDYIQDITVQRMSKVIGKRLKKKGELLEQIEFDEGGVSKEVGWQGGGDFVYLELMKYNELWMDRIQGAKASKDLVKLWKEIAETSFLNWYVNPEIPADAVKTFEEIGKSENGLEKQKKLLCELLNKNQLYVNLSEIDDEQFKVSESDKKLNREFFGEAYEG